MNLLPLILFLSNYALLFFLQIETNRIDYVYVYFTMVDTEGRITSRQTDKYET